MAFIQQWSGLELAFGELGGDLLLLFTVMGSHCFNSLLLSFFYLRPSFIYLSISIYIALIMTGEDGKCYISRDNTLTNK